MKKSLLILAVLVAFLAAACGKDRVCRCTPKDNDGETTMLTMDHGMSCKNVTQLGFERQLEGHLVRSMVEVDCVDEVAED